MKLYSYWRSTAAYRVRMALNVKKLDYIYKPVHLVKDGGEHLKQEYKTVNPQSLVPALETDNGLVFTQSLAIIDYLEHQFPEISLYPKKIPEKFQAKAMALSIACDIHPLNNLRVLKYLKQENWNQQQIDSWYGHWIHEGFTAIEKQLVKTAGAYCYGDVLSVADIFLVAQIYNANRFNIPLEDYPQILKINEECLSRDDVIAAIPENQPDCDV